MGHLEKVFLGTMVAFLSVVIFFFGLYFDLYEMLLGGAKESDPLLSVGEFAYTRSAMERVARPVEILPMSAGNSDFNLPASNQELAAMYSFLPKKADSKEVVSWWRERLKKAGMPEGELLEIEALGHDRESYGELMVRVNALLRAKDYETAAEMIEDAIKQTDARNLYVMRDLLAALLEACHLAGQTDRANQVARRLSEVGEKILDIKSRATGNSELAKAAAEAAAARDTLTAVPVLDEAAKADMKARLLKAAEDGKIPREEIDRKLEELE